MIKPAAAAPKERTTFNIMFMKAAAVLPDFRSMNVSAEKAENVVNPPKKPVTQRMRMDVFTGTARKTPAAKEPVTLTARIA